MKFDYALRDRMIFYRKYFADKVFFLWFEVKRPKLRMFAYEMLYPLKKFTARASMLSSPFDTELVETRFGKFRIRPHTMYMCTVSPAFERRDVDYLLELLQRLRDENKKVLFLDIGAGIGTFSVTVGSRFRDYTGLLIAAFEPAASSYALLEENIRLNNLKDKVEPHNLALFSEDDREVGFQFYPDTPGSSGLRLSRAHQGTGKVTTKTLNSVMAEKAYGSDAVVLKVDVEGLEAEVLKGGDKVFRSGIDVYIMVEDFVNPAIITYLEKIGADFIRKLTPYNSWWHYRRGEASDARG
jgi:FkbM family methyltransferase